ncbi:MAG: hypothetical protein A2W22_01750 [Candidatus Levybacteria bacterium RBG_16_35_11]|nr:MAG: hypothetical protein A2W22_01750 [Candidatus Levybacteria bacterium RBG_16_35_11]
MGVNAEELNQLQQKEFLQALHNEKIKTQSERADYTKSKLAFVIGLFGLGSLKIGAVESHWILYLIPLVAIGYDLYIRAADVSIKKIGAFLRTNPGTTKNEKEWENFSAKYRDTIAPIANTLFTFVVTIAAAMYIYALEQIKNLFFWSVFTSWLLVFLLIIVWMWLTHREIVSKIDNNNPKISDS